MMTVIMIIIAYLLGSVSVGILVCKFMKLPDPREQGSGNVGATNVMRVGGKNAAILTLIGDALKGLIPVLLARMVGVEGFMLAIVALAAVVGHMFSLFYGFKGGKGAATGFGGLLGLSFPASIIAVVVWLIVVAITRYVSLASLCVAALSVIIILFVHIDYFIPLLVIVALMIWKHMENIQRLRAGTENKFEWK